MRASGGCGGIMRTPGNPGCASCGLLMHFVEGVSVVESLRRHRTFECRQCGHIQLIAKAKSQSRIDWLKAVPKECPHIVIASPSDRHPFAKTVRPSTRR